MILKEKIIFLSSKNPFSPTGWSGIPYFMHQSLSRHYQVLHLASPDFKYLKLIGYYFSRITQKLFGKKYLMDYGILLSVISGIFNTRAVKKVNEAKFIFCPAGLSEVAFLKTDIPIINCGDCSMLQLIDYYPSLSGVLKISKWEVEFVERRALRKANLNFYSSSWSANFISAKFDLKNVKVSPFGANLRNPPQTQFEKVIPKKRCTIIFVSTDWVRKGGDFAMQVRTETQNLGFECLLIIIGSSPEKAKDINSDIKVFESIDKLLDDTLYEQKLKEAHFMILPTLADCTPIVIAEAFAYGLPVVASNTGGIPTMIVNGVNGFLMTERNPIAYAKIITDSLNNTERYQKMRRACFESFINTFNWSIWMSCVNDQVRTQSQK